MADSPYRKCSVPFGVFFISIYFLTEIKFVVFAAVISEFCLDVFIGGQFPWIYKNSNEGVLCQTGLEIIWLIWGSFSRSFTLSFKLRHFLAFLLLFIICSLQWTVTSVFMDIAVRNDLSSPGLHSNHTIVQQRCYCGRYALNTHRSNHSSRCD